MTAMAAALDRPDFDDVVSKLGAGSWAAFPYEAYGQLDRGEWNAELVKYLAERDIQADVIDVPKKSVVVVVNAAALPTVEQLAESIAAIEYRRAMGPR